MRTGLPDDFAWRAQAVAIGASAGGIDALFTLLDGLQPPVAAPILVVLHLPENHESQLVSVFRTRVGLPVREAEPHAPVEGGTLYFAPPGYHLLVEADHSFSLSCEPPVLFSRPSIDLLLESSAEAYGEGLAGMILTGASEDGARGLALVRSLGGLTAVQEPSEAAYAAMPAAAAALAQHDFVLPLSGLRRLLHTVVRP
jgi:two-component system, chemotaxis family, protein-glutamate methylesterase/glutaminase